MLLFLYINNVIKCLMSRWLIMFTIRVSWLILTISRGKNKDKKNDQITAKLVILELCFLILNIPPFWTETSNKSVRSGHDLLLSKSMWTHAFVIFSFFFSWPLYTVKSNVYKTIWWVTYFKPLYEFLWYTCVKLATP